MVFTPGTNPYFDEAIGSQGEQDLLEDLIIESIKIHGMNMVYLPKALTSYDPIYGEDDRQEFNSFYPVEMYLKDAGGFTGDPVSFGKFGLEIPNQITFTVSRRIFAAEVGARHNIPRPNEGDLIYYPLHQRLFSIKFVEYLPVHYQLGALYTYDLVCELFTYNQEKFNTGIPYIDDTYNSLSTDVLDWALVDEHGNYIVDEDGNYLVTDDFAEDQADPGTIDGQNDEIQEESDTFVDFTEQNPFAIPLRP